MVHAHRIGGPWHDDWIEPTSWPHNTAPAAGQDGVEVLTRGPVHEAFAETITFDPEPGIVAPKAPPAAIEEVPPQQRPEGKNVTWIPGYWGWDDERNDFLWVSGIWRALPPGRQWVPGYWGQSRQGAQWTSGYWADAAPARLTTCPSRRRRSRLVPTSPRLPPTIFGCQAVGFGSRTATHGAPDIGRQGNQDWDWVPDHYVWTPSGYVFVDGYYDYSVPRRGVVFAPVYFDGGLRTQRGFSYSPSTVINPGVFVSHLFLRPGYGHYYFGDYYGSNYANAGFSPWFSYQSSRRGYDPIYANQRWQHRRDRDWEHRTEANFRNLPRQRRRPAATHLGGTKRTRRAWGDIQPKEHRGGRAARRAGPEKRQSSSDSNRWIPQNDNSLASVGKSTVSTSSSGNSWKPMRRATPGGDPATAAGPARRKFSRSPFVAPPADQLGKNNAPPQRHQVLKPDFQVQPQPRTRGGRNRRTASGRYSGQGARRRGRSSRILEARRSNPVTAASRSGQGVNQGNRQGVQRPVTTPRCKPRASSAHKMHRRISPRGESKKKDKD